jgi:hypothetical protein
MEIVKVIVRKAKLPTYWYADKIGQVFECYQRGSWFSTCSTFQVVNSKFGQVCFIEVEDLIPYDFIGRKPIKKLKLI